MMLEILAEKTRQTRKQLIVNLWFTISHKIYHFLVCIMIGSCWNNNVVDKQYFFLRRQKRNIKVIKIVCLCFYPFVTNFQIFTMIVFMLCGILLHPSTLCQMK